MVPKNYFELRAGFNFDEHALNCSLFLFARMFCVCFLSALLSSIQFVPNTRTSHSLLASAQIGIVLSVPVHLERSHQAAKVDVHEVGNVFEKAATERSLRMSVIVHEMLVSCHVQAFIGRHT